MIRVMLRVLSRLLAIAVASLALTAALAFAVPTSKGCPLAPVKKAKRPGVEAGRRTPQNLPCSPALRPATEQPPMRRP